MTSPSFEVGYIHLNAGEFPNAVTVKVFDKSLHPIVRSLSEHFLKKTPEIWVREPDYDEYWIEYGGNLRALHNLLNLYLWMAVSDPEGLKRLAEEAAREIKNTTLVEFEDSGDGTYKIRYKVDGKLTAPFKIPDDIMDEAAWNGQDDLEGDVREVFVTRIISRQMKMQSNST